MDKNLIISLVKSFFLVIFTYIVYMKLINNRKTSKDKIIILVFATILISIIYVIMKEKVDLIFAVYAYYLLTNTLIKRLVNKNIGNSMLITLLSLSICFLLFILATFIAYIPYYILNYNNDFISLSIIIIIEFIIIQALFKIKRLKNGFDFLKDNNQNDYIDMIMLTISSVIILTYYLFGNYYGDKLTIHIFISLMALGIIMIIMIEKSLVLCYKQNLLKRELEEYKEEIKEKDKQMKKLSNEKYEISRINHEFYNRQKALELKVVETLSNTRMETAEEIDITNRIEKLTKEYSETMQKIKGKTKLPKADVLEIDDMFKYMQTECIKNNIEFELKINGNINYLINHFIPKNKLETMIGDHIRDAIIAINSSENNNKGILVILGIKENCYEFCICDTGIEFEIDTLLKLGLERTTTHKETGGTGIGFMTTFKTMNECMASLIIEEHPISNNNYTKAVTIRFDGKNEYRIKSYRASEIKKESNNNRIIIERL